MLELVNQDEREKNMQIGQRHSETRSTKRTKTLLQGDQWRITKKISIGNAALEQGGLKAIVPTSQEIVGDREKTGPLAPVQTGSMARQN